MPIVKSLVGLDPIAIKESLKDFLKDDDNFKDYNFEGSALSTIIDLLTKNTFYQVYMANMLANESFMETAQLRESVVSHARKLNYIPKSRRSPEATVNLLIKPITKTGLSSNITIGANKQFITNYENKVYNFTTNRDYTGFLDADSNYVVTDVEIMQGSLITNEFLYTGSEVFFEVPNKNIDTTTMRVYIKDSAASSTRKLYTQVDDITLVNGESETYYLYENAQGKFQIEFGDDILGKKLQLGNIVIIEYINANDEVLVNGADNFTIVSSIAGFTDIEITVIIPANGGAEKETISQLRDRAPKLYSSQNRAVTPDDYVGLLLARYPSIKSAFAWGGEENPEPAFGKVFIAVIPNEGFSVSQTVKDIIRDNVLKPYNVGSITPVIVDNKNILVDLDIEFGFDVNKTDKSFVEIEQDIITLANSYSDVVLEEFKSSFIRSKFEKDILDNVTGLTLINVNPTLRSTFKPTYGTVETLKFEFANSLKPSTILFEKIVVDGYTLTGQDYMIMKDDGLGNVDLYNVVDGTDERLLVSGIGTVDYDKGEIIINKVNLIYDIVRVGVQDPFVTATPLKSDIFGIREFVLFINNITTRLKS